MAAQFLDECLLGKSSHHMLQEVVASFLKNLQKISMMGFDFRISSGCWIENKVLWSWKVLSSTKLVTESLKTFCKSTKFCHWCCFRRSTTNEVKTKKRLYLGVNETNLFLLFFYSNYAVPAATIYIFSLYLQFRKKQF